MIISVHVLKNYSTNVVNRGEDGEPKSVVYGGTKRTRVSSQSRKHKWRTSDLFRNSIDDIGIRTRRIGQVIYDELVKDGYDENVARRVSEDFTIFIEPKTKQEDVSKFRTGTIQVYSNDDIDKIIKYIKNELDKEEIQELTEKLKAGKTVKKFIEFDDINKSVKWFPPIDTCLFGRMVTRDPSINVPASVYVAHAFSTHPSAEDVDFFAATDDLLGISDGEESGSAHLGNISFDTACFYEYAYIDTDILSDNMKNVENKEEVMKELIRVLIPTMVLETPNGKQTTMTSRPLPSAVLIEVLDNKMVFDYANAYVNPVMGYSNIVAESVKRLAEQHRESQKMYGDYMKVRKTLWMNTEGVNLDNVESFESLKDMVDAVVEEM